MTLGGGWGKGNHEHSDNAKSGIGLIFGALFHFRNFEDKFLSPILTHHSPVINNYCYSGVS